MGYEFYQCLDYPLSLGSKADCPDRYLSRFNEMIESCRIIRLILYPRSYEELRYEQMLMKGLGYASLCYELKGSERLSHELRSSLCSGFITTELLIPEFQPSFPFILSLINELKLSIESSKGIYTIYPNCFPYFTTNIIPIDYPTINQPNKFCRSINLGDPIAVLGPIDFVSGSVDLSD